MGSTSGLPKAVRKRFEALTSQVDSISQGHQSLLTAIEKSASKKKKGPLRKVIEQYHKGPKTISKVEVPENRSKKNRFGIDGNTIADRLKDLSKRSRSRAPNHFEQMMNAGMIGMHVAVLDHYLSEDTNGQSLFEYLSEQKSPIEAHRMISSINGNAEQIIEKNLMDLEDLGYFSGNKIQNPELAEYFINTIITLVAGKALDFEKRSADEYLAALPDYRKDTLKTVLEGKLSKTKFKSEDFANDPVNESPQHIQEALKRSSRLMVLATLDLMRQNKEKASGKLKNLADALKMDL